MPMMPLSTEQVPTSLSHTYFIFKFDRRMARLTQNSNNGNFLTETYCFVNAEELAIEKLCEEAERSLTSEQRCQLEQQGQQKLKSPLDKPTAVDPDESELICERKLLLLKADRSETLIRDLKSDYPLPE